jgi:RNA polymerase sigma-70 factor (ECF subfamily)
VGIRGTDLRTLERDYDALDDRMLVLDFQAGHPEAFVEIHHRHGPLARRVCGRYLRNPQDADEAFQETMIRVYQGLHRFNGTYALRPWIARIATNVSIDAIRAHDRRPEFDDDEVEDHDHADPDDGPEAAYERLIERDLVISVLEELPETHRTALVLRELEGRSHKEIGHAMGISSAQAKALIHRAKGSFRRGWLRAVTDRGGLAGIAMLPLIVTIKVFDGARKVLDRVVGHAGQVVQAATPEVVSSAASSPTVTNAVTSVGERVVATGMAVLIAGSVTVGAASLAKHDDPKKDAKVVAAAAPSVAPEPVVTAPVVAPREDHPKGDLPVEETAPVIEETTPAPSEEPTASESPATNPSESPSSSPTGEPTPPPPPAVPAWSYDFVSSTASVESCGCDAASVSPLARIEATEGGGFTFAKQIRGAARDASGDASWLYSLSQWGDVNGPDGHLEFRFRLTSAAGVFLYYGNGTLAEVVASADGSAAYRFEGTFELLTPQVAAPGLPTRGFVSATLGVWQDGTIYTGSFALDDTGAPALAA